MFQQKCKIPVRPQAILTATVHDPLAIPHIDPTIPVNVGTIPVRPHTIATATMHDPLAIPHIDPTIPVNVGVP